MDQQLNNGENEFLWEILANPAGLTHSHADNLQLLINDFPQSGILRALLVPVADEQAVKHAAAYFNPSILHKLANAPDSLAALSENQIVVFNDEEPEANAYFHDTASVELLSPQEEAQSPAITDADEAPVDHHETALAGDVPTDVIQQQVGHTPEDNASQEEINTAPLAEESSLGREYEEHLAKTSDAEKAEPLYTFDDNGENVHQDIEDEVYEEIVSIEDINLEQLAKQNEAANETEEKDIPAVLNEQETEKQNEATNETEDTPAILDEQEAEKDNIAEDKYFVFDTSFAKNDHQQDEDTQPADDAETEQAAHGEATKDVSKYNDEKLPYTFLWWLDKTRKDHAEIYQPYIVNNIADFRPTIKKDLPDELQQQYYENIFNINSVDELDKSTQPQIDVASPPRKEDKIIERFIQQEPQIQHPSGIKLDNENKAKKSSEDRDELVTETLARIYTEQMLYHKAIATYKKLMLKFPEKSLYFAGHIEQLEKKIN